MSKIELYKGDVVKIKDISYFNEALKTSGLLCVEADTIRGMRNYSSMEAKIMKIEQDGIIIDIDNGNFFWDEYLFIEDTVEKGL